MENYVDVLVLRHPMVGAADLAAEYASKPVINSGKEEVGWKDSNIFRWWPRWTSNAGTLRHCLHDKWAWKTGKLSLLFSSFLWLLPVLVFWMPHAFTVRSCFCFFLSMFAVCLHGLRCGWGGYTGGYAQSIYLLTNLGKASGRMHNHFCGRLEVWQNRSFSITINSVFRCKC